MKYISESQNNFQNHEENFKIRKLIKSLEKKLQNKLMAPVLILPLLYNSKQNKNKISHNSKILGCSNVLCIVWKFSKTEFKFKDAKSRTLDVRDGASKGVLYRCIYTNLSSFSIAILNNYNIDIYFLLAICSSIFIILYIYILYSDHLSVYCYVFQKIFIASITIYK